MKELGYNLLKNWIKVGLYCYYGRITVSGKGNIPKDKPVMFLPNHQNALLDVLLVGVDCNRKPWFLTRSDVFKNLILKKFFNYLQMIPIYRIRDGRQSLKNNGQVFVQCAELLEGSEAILMFPEANHNLKRRVRPLSKGFTRILFGTLNKAPELDIQLVPVGLNYKDAEGFPDRMAINFGKPIGVQKLYDKNDVHASTLVVKNAISDALKTLTTHIEDDDNYEKITTRINALEIDYLNVPKVTKAIEELDLDALITQKKPRKNIFQASFKLLGVLLNLPVILGWRIFLKPKVWEPEFTGTLRFAYSLLVFPIYYLLVFLFTLAFFTPLIALCSVLALFLFNCLFVKLA